MFVFSFFTDGSEPLIWLWKKWYSFPTNGWLWARNRWFGAGLCGSRALALELLQSCNGPSKHCSFRLVVHDKNSKSYEMTKELYVTQPFGKPIARITFILLQCLLKHTYFHFTNLATHFLIGTHCTRQTLILFWKTIILECHLYKKISWVTVENCSLQNVVHVHIQNVMILVMVI